MIDDLDFADRFDFSFFDDLVNNYVRISGWNTIRELPVINYSLCDDTESSGREVYDISEEDFDRILVLS